MSFEERQARLRAHPRFPLDAEVNLHWRDEREQDRVCRGKCKDISERGLGVLSYQRLPLRSYVHFQVPAINFRGSASVRSVRNLGGRYLVGLEFSGTLRWKPPATKSPASTAAG